MVTITAGPPVQIYLILQSFMPVGHTASLTTQYDQWNKTDFIIFNPIHNYGT